MEQLSGFESTLVFFLYIVIAISDEVNILSEVESLPPTNSEYRCGGFTNSGITSTQVRKGELHKHFNRMCSDPTKHIFPFPT